MDSSDLITTTDDSRDEKIRLLVCNSCHSIDPLPFYDGPDEYDVAGQSRAMEHRLPSGNFHDFIVGTVSEKSWNNPRIRPQILDKLRENVAPGMGSGLGNAFYEVKNTFEEDAYICWNQKHNRTENCDDFRTDKMKLIPDTQKDRKAEGLPWRSKDMPTNHWLCDYCVYKSVVQSRIAKGQK